jgi:hypothetical protein
MRDILFRAKSGQTWYYGGVHREKLYRGSIETNDYHYRWHIITDEGDEYRVRPDTICQYTGKVDIYGRKIFEGDIISCNGSVKLLVVTFDHGCWECIPYGKYPNVSPDFKHRLEYDTDNKYKVVGNMFDEKSEF